MKKNTVSISIVSLLTVIILFLMGCGGAAYNPTLYSSSSDKAEIIAAKAMAAQALEASVFCAEMSRPIYQRTVYAPTTPSPTYYGNIGASASAASAASVSANRGTSAASSASASATGYVATPSINSGGYDTNLGGDINVSSDGNSVFVEVDKSLFSIDPGDNVYLVGSMTGWQAGQYKAEYDPGKNAYVAKIPATQGTYQVNMSVQTPGTPLKVADQYWSAVHKSRSQWQKVNPSTQRGSINFTVDNAGNVSPASGM